MKIDDIKSMGWIKSVSKNNSGVGLTLEYLLNKPVENFELPDYNGIELKAKYSTKYPAISLFSAAPDSYVLEIKRIYEKYGYQDIENRDFKIFRLSVYSFKKVTLDRKNFFMLHVDRKKEQVVLNVYDYNGRIIDSDSAWSFEFLKEKLFRKLGYLAFVKAEKKIVNGDAFFKYISYDFYKLRGFDNFINLIENGRAFISFNVGVFKNGIKYGQIYDHGTSFRMKIWDLEKLFYKITII